MVIALIDQLLREYRYRERHIGVITPYVAQQILLRRLLKVQLGSKGDDIEVNSVEGFQGREKNVIIFSPVISNSMEKIGFM